MHVPFLVAAFYSLCRPSGVRCVMNMACDYSKRVSRGLFVLKSFNRASYQRECVSHLQKTAVAVAHCKAGNGSIKLNGEPRVDTSSVRMQSSSGPASRASQI
jgi:hypothetical protein